jgi:hypothetical protein
MAVKGRKCGRMSVPVCRTAKGRFRSQGKGTTTRKRKTTKRRKRRIAKGAVCKPSSVRRYRGKCGCKTRGGGFKFVKASRCRRKRR